jgi:hypothetical protein
MEKKSGIKKAKTKRPTKTRQKKTIIERTLTKDEVNEIKVDATIVSNESKDIKGNERNDSFERFKDNYSKPSKTVGTLAKTLGIEKLVKWVAGEDCGCDKRAIRLDRHFRGANCFTQDEYEYCEKYFPLIEGKTVVSREIGERFMQIYQRVFNVTSSCTTCSFRTRINKLKQYFNKYNS